MVYLTPDGHPASTFSLAAEERRRLLGAQVLVEVAYDREIARWLRSALPSVRAAPVAETLRQYLAVIEGLSRRQ